jgi:hypothetical protein
MRLYSKYDYDVIAKWCRIRDIPVPSEDILPETGIIIENVAVGFLILTNNNCAIIDFYISNPFSSKKDRKDAFDLIDNLLVELAYEAGAKKIICSTQHPNIEQRAINHGFKYLGKFSFFEKGI